MKIITNRSCDRYSLRVDLFKSVDLKQKNASDEMLKFLIEIDGTQEHSTDESRRGWYGSKSAHREEPSIMVTSGEY